MATDKRALMTDVYTMPKNTGELVQLTTTIVNLLLNCGDSHCHFALVVEPFDKDGRPMSPGLSTNLMNNRMAINMLRQMADQLEAKER